MNFRRKIIILVILVILIWSFVGYLPGDETLVTHYARNIFYPYQTFRGTLFGALSFSIGDIIYVVAGFALISGIVKWIFYIIKFGLYTEEIAANLLNAVNTVLFVYLLFIISWGGNYYKPSLAEYWGLEEHATLKLREQDNPDAMQSLRAKDSAALVAFDLFLINKLNRYALCYTPRPFSNINDSAAAYYHNLTDTKVKGKGLWIKPSLFSFVMERMAVDGYYNPFTGEGQVNTELPVFMLPFVVCHEMAHQAGIAAEGDANLMSYTICTTADDTAFKYSAYLNIWIYTNNRVYRHDSAMARRFEARLNSVTLAQLDTLEQISQKYRNGVARYSNKIYDSYLKMQNQKEGIRSYGDVVISAWQVEQRRNKNSKGLIDLP